MLEYSGLNQGVKDERTDKNNLFFISNEGGSVISGQTNIVNCSNPVSVPLYVYNEAVNWLDIIEHMWVMHLSGQCTITSVNCTNRG